VSRAYQISLSESLRRHIRVDDGIKASLEILDVLPREAMRRLLEAELGERGFESREGVMVRVDPGGVEITIDPGDYSVVVRLRQERDLQLEREASTRAYEEVLEQAREKLRGQVRSELESDADEAEAELRAAVTAELERQLGTLSEEMDRLSNRVVANALKQRAATLGEIEAIEENDETGELTIRVRV
jgi:hypothetical protein